MRQKDDLYHLEHRPIFLKPTPSSKSYAFSQLNQEEKKIEKIRKNENTSKKSRTTHNRMRKPTMPINEVDGDLIPACSTSRDTFLTSKPKKRHLAIHSHIRNNKVLKGPGPSKSVYHNSSSERFDYQPNICKDYKETGYCGYGEACKFLHDRSDYKSGWQIKNENACFISSHTLLQAIPYDESGSISSETKYSNQLQMFNNNPNSLPLACALCHDSWSETSKTVKTVCGHYFHEQCALKHHSRISTCFVCESATKGIFNAAKEIYHIINRKNSIKQANQN